VETVSDFILGGSKITADGDCSHEIKRGLLQEVSEQLFHTVHEHGQYQIRLTKFFRAKDGKALYSPQKYDVELTVAQIISSLLHNSGSN